MAIFSDEPRRSRRAIPPSKRTSHRISRGKPHHKSTRSLPGMNQISQKTAWMIQTMKMDLMPTMNVSHKAMARVTVKPPAMPKHRSLSHKSADLVYWNGKDARIPHRPQFPPQSIAKEEPRFASNATGVRTNYSGSEERRCGISRNKSTPPGAILMVGQMDYRPAELVPFKAIFICLYRTIAGTAVVATFLCQNHDRGVQS